MVDPLRDPDDPELLDPYRARELATLVEAARLASGAVRYGKVGRVGCAQVVVNRDNPLPLGNHACAVYGSSAEVAGTLMRLEQTFADVGRAEAVVYASPTTVAEIEGIADDAGWYAVEESLAIVHRGSVSSDGVHRGSVSSGGVHRGPVSSDGVHRGAGAPSGGPGVRVAVDADLPGLAALLADDLGAEPRRLARHLGQRMDDARCVFVVVDDGERLAGFASGFAERGVGLVEHVVVRPARRRRGVGTALVHGVAAAVRDLGALLVAAHVAEGGAGERFAEACGFETGYPVTAYARRVDELLD
ncbi:GNAT family N-acetyltransferase [Actinosynnema sp. NPDC047251]|uniref:N-acetyltransferase n=1 Tax=Saccharothrix espanaensis (strain ATCC 51144 / DSM 44229 / JCM 9112 / NBRC 15066 / NRRL 15764) TaxID=1179773 RepID=K0JS77_SACES|nr:GNAT family N-acetyltransferase [Saccharothrix espanaensis]CCH28362.1 N-acetyltransferase [Saccharothrix espanaensis DSM 44229]